MKTGDFLRSAGAVVLLVCAGSAVSDKVGGVDAVIGLAVSSVWLACEVAYVIWMTGGEVTA